MEREVSWASKLLRSHRTQFLNLEDFFLWPMYCTRRFVVLLLYAFGSNGLQRSLDVELLLSKIVFNVFRSYLVG